MTQQQWGQPPSGQQAPWNQQWNSAPSPQWAPSATPHQGYTSAVRPGQLPMGNPHAGWPQGQPAQLPYGQPQYRPGQWGQPVGPASGGVSNRGALLKAGIAIIVVIIAGVVIVSMLNRGGNEVAYQNEDYQVPQVETSPPEIPVPNSESEIPGLLNENSLYQQNVGRPVRCDLPSINLQSATKPELEDHFTKLTECLSRVWGPPIEAAGYVPVRFKSNVYSGTADSPCGKLPRVNAVFCPVNQQMYFSTDLIQAIPPELRDKPFLAETVWAHEFGHGIQTRTKILVSASYLERNAKSKPEAMLMGRRLETQADCFAGLFIGSTAQSLGVTEPDVANMLAMINALGDDVLSGDPNIDAGHGHGVSRQYWLQLGMSSTSIGACNTFIAPPEKVR